MILTMQNAILEPDEIAGRIAQQSLAKRGADYASEVRRLLDAALTVMRERGTTSRPRVADIVGAAGLSNDAFYRHFSSKDALVTAKMADPSMTRKPNRAQYPTWARPELGVTHAHPSVANRRLMNNAS